MKYRYENVICERVVDGDTIDVEIDFGFKLKKKERLRLYGINAPETRGKEKEKGLKSKERLIALIEGKNIVVETEKKGKFGRYLAKIYYQNKYINRWLVNGGFAEYKDY